MSDRDLEGFDPSRRSRSIITAIYPRESRRSRNVARVPHNLTTVLIGGVCIVIMHQFRASRRPDAAAHF